MTGEPGFVFAAPRWLWLLPVVAACGLLRWRQLASATFAPAWLLRGEAVPGLPALPRPLRARLWLLPALLQALAAGLLVVALARPVLRVEAPRDPPGRDLLLCLDQSSSMAATDLLDGRSRHDVGREVAAAFVRARPYDRIGFVAFARYCDLRCPPTRDHDAVVELLRALPMVEPDGPEDATAIGAAVATAAAALRRAGDGGKVVVVVTDGEENVANALAPAEIAPLHAAQLCAEAGIRVHTIVVGRGNLQPDGRFVALDTRAVEQLAAETGGRHFRAADAAALAAVYAEIDRLEATPGAPPGVRDVEWYPAVLALVLAATLASRLLAATWLRRLA